MKVKFTAEIIDDDGNVVGKRTSEEGGIPSMETFDISTREGFLRDFDLLEMHWSTKIGHLNCIF